LPATSIPWSDQGSVEKRSRPGNPKTKKTTRGPGQPDGTMKKVNGIFEGELRGSVAGLRRKQEPKVCPRWVAGKRKRIAGA